MENRIEKALGLIEAKPYLATMGANTVAARIWILQAGNP